MEKKIMQGFQTGMVSDNSLAELTEQSMEESRVFMTKEEAEKEALADLDYT
jgi:hypothetical protein